MKLFAESDAVEFVKTGKRVLTHSRSTRITPMARDVLTEAGIKVVFDPNAGDAIGGGSSTSTASPAAAEPASTSPAPASSAPAGCPCGGTCGGGAGGGRPVPEPGRGDKGGSGGMLWEGAAPSAEDLALFTSAETEDIKRQMVDIGRRIWEKDFVDGNGGNLSVRLGPDRFLCTPTLVSKGFMHPSMIAMVDGKGNQIAGRWKRTSEFFTHLAIYRGAPEAVAVAHAHPCNANAFGIAGVAPPPRLIPELEVFVGTVPLAPYRTPGSDEMAQVIEPLAAKHQSILMGNHGVISWGLCMEDAYFKMEITDAYCRTLLLGMQIPAANTSISCEGLSELLELKKGMGLPDPRYGLKPVELCEVDPWQVLRDPCATGTCATPAPASCSPVRSSTPAGGDPAMEQVVQKITDEIMRRLGG